MHPYRYIWSSLPTSRNNCWSRSSAYFSCNCFWHKQSLYLLHFSNLTRRVMYYCTAAHQAHLSGSPANAWLWPSCIPTLTFLLWIAQWNLPPTSQLLWTLMRRRSTKDCIRDSCMYSYRPPELCWRIHSVSFCSQICPRSWRRVYWIQTSGGND